MKKGKDAKSSDVVDEATSATLDLTGLKCPLPVLKARRQISQMAGGAVLVVKADDPAAPLDFDHFCRTSGHILVKSEENFGVFTIRIVKSSK